MSASLNAIRKAYAAHRKSAAHLAEVIAKRWPIGTILEATFGKHRITCRVTSHPQPWWSEPASVGVENVITGKRRRLHAGYGGHDIVVIQQQEGGAK